MEKFEQKLLDEIKKLLDDIAATEEPSEAKFFEWKARAENLIVRICGEGSSYHRNLMEIEEEVMRIEKARLEVEILPVNESTFAQYLREIRSEFLKQAIGGILRGLYKDLDSGL